MLSRLIPVGPSSPFLSSRALSEINTTRAHQQTTTLMPDKMMADTVSIKFGMNHGQNDSNQEFNTILGARLIQNRNRNDNNTGYNLSEASDSDDGYDADVEEWHRRDPHPLALEHSVLFNRGQALLLSRSRNASESAKVISAREAERAFVQAVKDVEMPILKAECYKNAAVAAHLGQRDSSTVDRYVGLAMNKLGGHAKYVERLIKQSERHDWDPGFLQQAEKALGRMLLPGTTTRLITTCSLLYSDRSQFQAFIPKVTERLSKATSEIALALAIGNAAVDEENSDFCTIL